MAAFCLGSWGALAGAPERSLRPEARPVAEAAEAAETSAAVAGVTAPVGTADGERAAGPAPAALVVATGQGLVRSPRPEARPDHVLGAARRIAASTAAADGSSRSPVAATRGAGVATAAVVAVPRPQARDGRDDRGGLLRRVFAPRSQPSREGTIGRRGTLAGIPGLEGETIPPIRGRLEGCGVDRPLRVTSVGGIRLSQPAIMDADTARALAQWVETGAKPAIGRAGGGIAAFRVAAHYTCRTRNHRKNARISEHGKGRAIDISAITLRNGEVMTVLSDYRRGRHARALKQMHRAACGPFATTLGPGSDGMHEDHFHFDTARRSGRPYCR